MISQATPSDAEALGKVKIQAWKETYSGFVNRDFLASLTVEDQANRFLAVMENEKNCVFAAWHNGEIVGYAIVGPNQSDAPESIGELQAIYLLHQAQGLGLGKKLVARSIHWLIEKGYESAHVWCFAQNINAAKFYQYLGGERINESTFSLGGDDHPDECYLWPDLPALLRKTQE